MNDVTEKKHAYLIIAHTNFNQLKILLRLLDDSRNDIYLHIGADIRNVDFTEFTSICVKSRLYFANKRLVGYWGGKSLVDITLLLLGQAISTSDYSYYHLLSGMDLPIKTQEYIHNFFENNYGYEFVDVISHDFKDKSKNYRKMISRVKYYHLFTHLFLYRKYGAVIGKVVLYLHAGLDRLSILVQRMFGIDRISLSNLEIYKGSQWFSITQDFAKFLVSKQPQIDSLVKYSICADEIFVQTMIMNSSFRSSISINGGDLRHIDWKRGSPYTFRNSDYLELIQSDKLFARKFDEKIDAAIIDKIYNHLKEKS